MVNIEMDLLRRLLREAYDAGQRGVFELGNKAVEGIIADHKDELNDIETHIIKDYKSHSDIGTLWDG